MLEKTTISKKSADVTAYVQTVLDEMDVDARLSRSHNRRTVNMQIDTNEPGRVIITTEKSLALFNLWRKITSITVTKEFFYITTHVNYEHRAEVLQMLCLRMLPTRARRSKPQMTDSMSNGERKNHSPYRSKMEGVITLKGKNQTVTWW